MWTSFWSMSHIVQGSRYKLSFDGMHYLLIPQVRPADAGEIVVTARSVLGEVQFSTSLDVFLTNDFRNFQLRATIHC